MVDAVRLIGQTKAVGDVDKRLDTLELYGIHNTLSSLRNADISLVKRTFIAPNAPSADFYWTLGDFTNKIDDVNYVSSSKSPTSTGAWVRQRANQIQCSIGNVIRTVEDKLSDIKSLIDYGAKGDGIVDDTLSIQRALDANWLNGTLDGGGKTYKISSSLKIMRASRHLCLQNCVFVIGDHTFLEDKVNPTLPDAKSIQFFHLDKVFVDAQAHTILGRRIVDFTRFTRSKFSNLFLYGKSGRSVGLYGIGIDGESPYYNIFENIETGTSAIGIMFDDYKGSTDGGCNSNTVIRLRAQPQVDHFGIYVGEGSQNISIMDSAFECPNGGVGIYNNGEATRISGNRFESLSVAVIWLGGADCGVADGNYFSSNTINHQFFGNSDKRNTIINEKGADALYGTQQHRIPGTLALGGLTFGQDVLKHYDEGTFTPVLQGSDSNGNTTYTTQIGYFTRIGRMVFIQGSVAWSSTTAVGSSLIGGLPFPTSNISDLYLPIEILSENFTYTGSLKGVIIPGSITIGLYTSASGSAAIPAPMDTSAGIRFSGSYMV